MSYFTYQPGARLITRADVEAREGVRGTATGDVRRREGLKV